jgi:hypothetical protein
MLPVMTTTADRRGDAAFVGEGEVLSAPTSSGNQRLTSMAIPVGVVLDRQFAAGGLEQVVVDELVHPLVAGANQ